MCNSRAMFVLHIDCVCSEFGRYVHYPAVIKQAVSGIDDIRRRLPAAHCSICAALTSSDFLWATLVIKPLLTLHKIPALQAPKRCAFGALRKVQSSCPAPTPNGTFCGAQSEGESKPTPAFCLCSSGHPPTPTLIATLQTLAHCLDADTCACNSRNVCTADARAHFD